MKKAAESASVRGVAIAAGGVILRGDLSVPDSAHGLVLFAHGSGSSRLSGRNRWVARELNDAGLATLLFDLLTEEEERVDAVTRALRFDIPLLAQRLSQTTGWVMRQPALASRCCSTGTPAGRGSRVELVPIPWVVGWIPVIRVTTAGLVQHDELIARLKVAPSRPSRSRVGVRASGEPEAPSRSARRASTR